MVVADITEQLDEQLGPVCRDSEIPSTSKYLDFYYNSFPSDRRHVLNFKISKTLIITKPYLYTEEEGGA